MSGSTGTEGEGTGMESSEAVATRKKYDRLGIAACMTGIVIGIATIYSIAHSRPPKSYSEALVALQGLESTRTIFLEETTRNTSTDLISPDLVSKVDELIPQIKENIRNIENSQEMREYKNRRKRNRLYQWCGFGAIALLGSIGFYSLRRREQCELLENCESEIRRKL